MVIAIFSAKVISFKASIIMLDLCFFS